MNPHSYRLKGRDFVHQGKIEIDVNERAVFIRTQGCFFVYTNSDCFLNSYDKKFTKVSHCIKSERCIFLDQEVADMANEDKKDFNAMLHDNKDMPKFQIITDEKSIEKYGGNRMYFAPPIAYDEVMKKFHMAK